MTKEQFLAMSLPFGLVIRFDKYDEVIEDKMVGMELGSDGKWYCHYDELGEVESADVKPLLKPISPVFGEIGIANLLKLIEWHYDVAGLIVKGEAIDVNTLACSPYQLGDGENL